MKNSKKSKMVILLPITTIQQIPKNNAAMDTRGNNVTVQLQDSNNPMVISEGQWDLRPRLQGMTQTIANAAGTGAAAVTAYFLNESDYNLTATNNGSGAASVTKTYGDGWSGKGYNNLAKLYASDNGIKCYGFTLQYTLISGGTQDTVGITLANPTWLMANLVGANMVPVGFVLGTGTRNTQYLQGTMTMKGIFYLSPMNQISYAVPVGDNSTLTIMTNPF